MSASSSSSSSSSQQPLVGPSSSPQSFILVVTPPSTPTQSRRSSSSSSSSSSSPRPSIDSISPPSYSLSSTHCQHQPPSHSLSLRETSFGFNHSTEEDDLSLPLYTSRASSSTEEPFTTAKWCFQWGFLLPLLWIGGVLVFFLPLQPITELEEADATKRAHLTEILVVLRETELKWARRCITALLVWIALMLGGMMVVLAVMLSRK